MRACTLFIVGLAACGHHAAPAPPPIALAPPTAEAQPAGADDPIVARVDGRPVYGSCVAAQAQALHLDAHAALDQCIAFELLAGAAEAKGLREDPDVIDAWRREMVRKVIETDLGKMRTLDDLPKTFVEPLIAGKYLQRPLQRVSQWARAVVPKTAARGGPEDQAAQAVAETAYQALATDDGVLPDELTRAMKDAAKGSGVKVDWSKQPYATPEGEDWSQVGVKPFREALYSIPTLGRVAPPIRTDWGWDVILWADTIPADDLHDDAFAGLRLKYFSTWSDAIARADGLDIAVDDAAFQARYGMKGP